VLPDLAILGIAQRPPSNPSELRHVRGVEDRHAKGQLGSDLMDAIVRGTALDPTELRDVPKDDLDRTLRPAVTLVSAWVSQLARDHDIDTALVATRHDLAGFLSDPPSGRLTTGWRNDLVGAQIRRLVDGRSALAFDGRGGLRLIELDGE
jgi:ribonuclease D